MGGGAFAQRPSDIRPRPRNPLPRGERVSFLPHHLPPRSPVPLMPDPLFRRLALLGIGLIGSSVARIARERGDIAAEIVVNARTQKTLDRVVQLGFADRVELDPARAVEGADCVMLAAPVGAFADLAAQHRAASRAGSDPDRCRLDQAVGDPRRRAAGAGGRAFRAGPSGGRHRILRPRCRLHHPVPGPLDAADAAARHRRDAVEKVAELWRRCGSMIETHGAGASRPGAGDRVAPAASDRLHHLRHRRRPGGRKAGRRC